MRSGSTRWLLAGMPAPRILPHGEAYVEPVQWPCAASQMKLGRSVCLFYQTGNWRVSSRSTYNASERCGDESVASHFWRVFETLGHRLPENTNLCFAFELFLVSNQAMSFSDRDRLLLTTMFDKSTYVSDVVQLRNIGCSLWTWDRIRLDFNRRARALFRQSKKHCNF